MGKALIPVGSIPNDTIPIDTLPLDTIHVDTIPVDTIPILPPTDSSGLRLIGDWMLVKVILNTPPDSEQTDVSQRASQQTFVTVKPSGELIQTYMKKIGDFWIKSILSGKWKASGDTLSMYWAGDSGDTSKWAYSINGDTLTCAQINGDNGGTERQTYISGDPANFKGPGEIYTRDPALKGNWVLKVNDTIGLYLGLNGSFGGSEFSNYDNRYIDVSKYDGGVTWYADGGKLFVFGLKCDSDGDSEDGHSCVSYSIEETVELEYMPGEGDLLLLGFPGSNKDVWAPLPSGGGKVK
jgi:hypothetical protein